MKIIENNSRKTYIKQNRGLVIFLGIIIGFSTYIGYAMYIYYDIGDFNRDLERYYWPDSKDYAYTGDREFEDFYSEDANWTFLEERAYIYENWTNEYCIAKEEWDCSTTHISINFKEGMTSPFTDYSDYQDEVNDFLTNSTSKFRNISYEIPFGDYGDSPCWTGVYMASLGFHYAVACERGDAEEANDVLEKLIRPVEGLHISTHVSGLDGNLVRFAFKDTKENRKRMLDVFYKKDAKGDYTIEKEFGSENNLWPGQGKYDDWVYVDDTSRDQHFGMFYGYGLVYKLLKKTDMPSGINESLRDEILDQIAEDGTDVVDCLMGANWHVIAGERIPGYGRGVNGASMHPRTPWASGGDFMIGALSFAKMVDSEKYSAPYKTIMNRFLATSYQDMSIQASSYYGNNLAYMNLFLAWFLGDKDYKEQVKWHFNHDYYENLKYHRNVMANLGYFIVNELDLEDILESRRLTYVLDDVTENLDSFARWKFPHRVWHIPEPDDYDDIIHKKNKMYHNLFKEGSTHILNYMYGYIFQEMDLMIRSKFALGVKTMPPSNFVWQRSPFHITGHEADDEDYKGEKQMGGIDFTLPYWMGQYYEYFE